MKKWIAMLLVLALMLALAGCQRGASVAAEDPAGRSDNTRETPAPTPAPETDAPTESAAPVPETTAETPTETPTEAPAPEETSPIETENEEPDASNAYGLVRNQLREVGSYSIQFDDDYTQINSYSFRVPELTEDTAGARQINQQISQRFLTAAQTELAAIEQNIGSSLVEMGWYVELWGGVVSLVVYETLDWGQTDYEVYYYDSGTGAALSPDDMLSRLVLTESEFLEGVRTAVREQYDRQYANIPEEDRESYGYYTMREQIDGSELINMSLVKFSVSEGPQICVIAPVPSLAGANYYYQVLYPSFAMG